MELCSEEDDHQEQTREAPEELILVYFFDKTELMGKRFWGQEILRRYRSRISKQTVAARWFRLIAPPGGDFVISLVKFALFPCLRTGIPVWVVCFLSAIIRTAVRRLSSKTFAS
jgi:hypothetical protein